MGKRPSLVDFSLRNVFFDVCDNYTTYTACDCTSNFTSSMFQAPSKEEGGSNVRTEYPIIALVDTDDSSCSTKDVEGEAALDAFMTSLLPRPMEQHIIGPTEEDEDTVGRSNIFREKNTGPPNKSAMDQKYSWLQSKQRLQESCLTTAISRDVEHDSPYSVPVQWETC